MVAPLSSHSTYVTTKHGVVGLSKAAAIDYAPEGIRVNVVLPGSIETEIWDNFPATKLELQAYNFSQFVPMRRFAKPIEVAKPVVFLLSDGASYITGTQLSIDGGYTAM